MGKRMLCLLVALGIGVVGGGEALASNISGTVTDVNGEGIKGAIVLVEDQDVQGKTGSNGSFTLKNVEPGNVFLYISAPSEKYLDNETRKSLQLKADSDLKNIQITLSGRPGMKAEYVGIKVCAECHAEDWPGIFKAFDGSPDASVHSRFVNEGTDRMIYPEMWPRPGDVFIPRDPKGNLLMVQDPLDGEGLVNVVLCTEDGKNGRQYLFKFYPEQSGDPLQEKDLDSSRKTRGAVWIPVGATIGGQGNWGEGYVDPAHEIADKYHQFGEGKQRWLARVQDVPYLKKWMEDNGVPVEKAKQDYVAYMPVYLMQDGTPVGSDALAEGDVGTPKFWQKGPTHWCPPTNTLSRGCAGCHATGVKIKKKDVLDDPKHPHKQVVTHFDYIDLNTTCERCHGPGSEHADSEDKAKIIMPQYLTVKAGNELCGQCHGSHSGKSERPMGVHKYPFDQANVGSLGNGYFVPGVYDLDDFYFNNDKPSVNNKWKEGTYNTWPDQIHARAHSMMLSEVRRSVHNHNSTEKLTCTACHDAHTLDGGPASLVVDGYDFKNAAYWNNTLCLACHAGSGPFAEVGTADVAVLQVDADRVVTRDGKAVSVDPDEGIMAKSRVAKAVAKHMQVGAGMGGALYTPEDMEMPVGSCVSCHMAKIGKLFDLNDDAQYHLARDSKGMIAVAEGNVGNHIMDIVWPGQSSVLKKSDPAQGNDYDIMPNSCSRCHAFARMSGDLD
ncbi:MAG: carboxypeptidase-like regulatory domain-containing protein [Gemmatimonadales bacterium]|nr:carboxypeptidase-like regulatory domain-containing protein [Gemmatimonadales bacterium]